MLFSGAAETHRVFDGGCSERDCPDAELCDGSCEGVFDPASPLLETASSFLLIHAVAALGVSGLALVAPRRGAWFLGSALMFLLGSLLFCGDLSLRALTDARLFPMAAPIGGTMLILGWIWVFGAALAVLSAKMV